MNEAQKLTLRMHTTDIQRDLDLDADLLGKLMQHGIFNEDMVEEIKKEGTRKEKVQKMLLILPRRGPKAFGKFIFSIQSTYPWIADKLRKTYSKISSKQDPELLSLKDRVEIFVHEHFGNSRRICEEDKKDIKKFLYKHLKHHHEDDVLLHATRRRASLESIDDTAVLATANKHNVEKEIEQKVLKKVYRALSESSQDHTNAKKANSNELDEVDGIDNQITFEQIEDKINEMNGQLQSLQNELNDCFNALGIEDCDKPLHEVLERLVDLREREHTKMDKMRECLSRIQTENEQLTENLYKKEKEIQIALKDAAHHHHSLEKYEEQIKQLRADKERLERLHVQHAESLSRLSLMNMGPLQKVPKTHKEYGIHLDECDGPPVSKSINLPQLAPKSGRGRHRSKSRDKKKTVEYPRPHASLYGVPWKH